MKNRDEYLWQLKHCTIIVLYYTRIIIYVDMRIQRFETCITYLRYNISSNVFKYYQVQLNDEYTFLYSISNYKILFLMNTSKRNLNKFKICSIQFCSNRNKIVSLFF